MLDINRELILFKNMQKTGYNVTFKNDVAVVEECNEHYIMAKFNEKGYYISEFTPIKAAVKNVEHDAGIDLWHIRLGYS